MSVKALLKSPGKSAAGNDSDTQNLESTQEKPAENSLRLREAVDPEALDLAWRAYGKTLEQNDPRLFSIISNNPPVLIDKERIRVELTSSLQQDDLLRVKPQLMLFLKKEVKNDFLELETAIKTEEEEGPRKAFTATEKLEAMMQKNPALALLRQQFNLDID